MSPTIWVAVFVVTVAALAPNLTAVALPRFVPVIVTLVPPAVGPADGLTLVTTGRGGLTVAVPVALAVEPPTSLIVIVVVNEPVLEYVCVPVTLKPPPALVATVPAVAAVPSPQAIVAVKSEA